VPGVSGAHCLLYMIHTLSFRHATKYFGVFKKYGIPGPRPIPGFGTFIQTMMHPKVCPHDLLLCVCACVILCHLVTELLVNIFKIIILILCFSGCFWFRFRLKKALQGQCYRVRLNAC